jgi:hypothetical protein
VSLPVDPAVLWQWLPVGYALTVAFEAPVLLAGLGRGPTRRLDATAPSASAPSGPPTRRYAVRQRIAASLWLTAVTYPIVAVVLPIVLWPREPYLTYVIAAETFAIAVECLLFRVVWHGTARDLMIVALANVVSASVGWIVTSG